MLFVARVLPSNTHCAKVSRYFRAGVFFLKPFWIATIFLCTSGSQSRFSGESSTWLAAARTTGGTCRRCWPSVKLAPIHSVRKSTCGAPPDITIWRK